MEDLAHGMPGGSRQDLRLILKHDEFALARQGHCSREALQVQTFWVERRPVCASEPVIVRGGPQRHARLAFPEPRAGTAAHNRFAGRRLVVPELTDVIVEQQAVVPDGRIEVLARIPIRQWARGSHPVQFVCDVLGKLPSALAVDPQTEVVDVIMSEIEGGRQSVAGPLVPDCLVQPAPSEHPRLDADDDGVTSAWTGPVVPGAAHHYRLLVAEVIVQWQGLDA